MKRIWGFGREKGMSPLGSASSLQRQGRGFGQKNNGIDNLLRGYHVQERDLRKIHKAACVGNAAQVQQILFFAENGVDDRDKMNRTALHLACAYGHPEVVTLLVERKCHLNLCDHENRTALMKAVQCQEEKCVNILLENGADPNIRDVSGNTALHYAAFGDNISIVEKLLLYNANTEARNKDNITPLLVAVNENKQQIVEVLVEKAANIHAEDKLKRTAFMLAVNYDSTNVVRLLLQQRIDPFPQDVYGWAADEYAYSKGFNLYEIICRHKEEIMLKNSLQNSNAGADKNAEEDSITRLSNKPGLDDSWSTSARQDLDFGTKNVPKSRIAKLLHSSWQFIKNMRPKRGTMKPEDGTLSEDSNPDSENKDMAETLSKPPVRVYGDPVPVLPSSKSLLKPSLKTLAVLGLANCVSEKPNKYVPHVSGAVDQKGQSVLNGQVEGADKNAEEDSVARLSDKPGPDDSWSTSSRQDLDFGTKCVSEKPNKYVPHVSGAVDQKGQSVLNGQVEGADKNAEEDSVARLSDKPGPDDSWSTSSSQDLDFGTKCVSEKPNKYVPHVSGAVDQKGQSVLNGQVEGADKNAEEDSVARLSDKPGPDDSWSTSSSQDLDFGTKCVSEKPNKYVPHVSGAVDQKGQSVLNGQVEGADKNAEEDSVARLSDKPGPDDSWSTSSSQDLDFGTKCVSEKPNKYVPHVSGAVDQKGQSVLNGQVEGADKNAEEDSVARLSDKPGPDDSWSTSSRQDLDFGTKCVSEKPNKYVPHVSGAVDQKGQSVLNGQVEGADKNAEEDSVARLSDKPGPDDSWSTSSRQDLDFGTKCVSEKPNKYVPHVSGAVDQKGQSVLNGQVEGADKNAEEDSVARLSDKPGPDDSWSTSSRQDLDFGTKCVSEKPNKYVPHVSGAVDQKGQSVLNGQVEGADKNAEEDSVARLSDKPGPDDSWSTSSRQDLDFGTKCVSEKPNKYVPHVSGAVDQKGQSVLNGQVEGADKNAEEDSVARLSDKPGPDDSWSTSSRQDLDFGTKCVSEKPNKYVPHVSGAVDQKGQSVLNGQVEGADKNAEEDSVARLSDKPGPDDSWSTSSRQDLDFGTKCVSEKPNKYVPHVSGAVDQKGQSVLNGQVEGADKNAEEDSVARLSDKPGPDDSWSTSSRQDLDFGTKCVSEKPNKYVPHVSGAVDQKGQSVLNGQVEGADKNAEEDSVARLSDKPGPDDSWSTSSSQDLDFGTKCVSEKPNKYVPHVSGAVDQKGQSVLNGQVEGADKNAEEDSVARLSDKPGPDDSWSTSSRQDLDFGTKEGTSKSAMEAKEDGVGIIENVPPEQAVNDSLTSAGGVHKNYRSDIMSAIKLGEEEDVESPSLPEYQVPLKVEEKKKHRGSDMEVSENIHDVAAAGLIPQRQNGKTDNHQLPITENKDSDMREPGLHMKKLKKGENEKGTSKGSVITPVLQKADSLTGGPLQKNDGSHFSEKDQHENRPAKKISKKKNKVKKQITSMDDLVDFIQSSEAASEHCELPYSKNFMLLIEQLGMDCKDYAGFLKIQDICVSYEKLRKLNKNHCKLLMGKITKMEKMVSALQNELQEAKGMISRLEHQKVEWEREFCSLRCTLKQEEEEERRNADMLYENIREKLRRKEDEYKKEVETKQQVELTLRTLNMELKATKNQVVEERSDTQWQLSPEQKARVLQDGSLNNHFCKQKELEMAHKKTNSKVVVRQLQQELADTLKKQSMSHLHLEDETRDLKKKLGQIRSQLQEEQERHAEAVRYAEEMKDHVQKLQVKNATQEATIKHQVAQIQDLESNVIKTSLLQEAQKRHAEAVRYAEKIKDHMLKLKVKNARQEETIKHQAAQIQDLQSNLLKASLLQEAKDREAEAIRYAEKTLEVQNARQEETIKHQAAQIQDLQSNLLKTSLLQEAKDQHAEAIRYAEKMLEVQHARPEGTIKQQAAPIHNLPSNLLKTSLADVPTTELETTSSKCLHLDAKNQVLQQELLSMKSFEEEREKLESNNKKLQQEVVKLKQFMEMNMVERSQMEQYKREIEERARLDIEEKLHEVNLFLQAQAAAQEDLDQLRENAHASTRSQMELRIRDLESQVSTMKTSQEDSTKTELETYRQLYLEELKVRKSLRNKLNTTNERLSESNTKLLVERQQHQTLLRTLTMSPGLEPPYCGHFENNLVLNGNFTPGGNLVIPTLNPQPSYDYWETSLWKMQRELEKE